MRFLPIGASHWIEKRQCCVCGETKGAYDGEFDYGVCSHCRRLKRDSDRIKAGEIKAGTYDPDRELTELISKKHKCLSCSEVLVNESPHCSKCEAKHAKRERKKELIREVVREELGA